MHNLLLILFMTVCGSICGVSGKDVEWTQLLGSQVGNQHSQVAKVAPSSHSKSYPGSRAGAATWKDMHGNLLLFGGEGFDEKPSNEPHLLNDLWLFNGTTEQWKLVNTFDAEVQRNSGQHRLMPKPRKGAVACGVQGILFVLFGGEGSGKQKLYDTWIYNIPKAEWLPLYKHFLGDKKPDHPPARFSPVSWCQIDKLVIFSGVGANNSLLSDMWVFSLRTLEWKLVTQTRTGSNHPLPRVGAASWVHSDSEIYMFGGSNSVDTVPYTQPSVDSNAILNDLWRLDLKNNTWYLLQNATLTVSILSRNVPNPRQFCSHWTDSFKLLWISRGEGYRESQDLEILSDTWFLNVSTLTWTKLPEPSNSSLLSHLNTIPSGRVMSAAWEHKNLAYILGGFGYDGRGRLSFLNDMWTLRTRQRGLERANRQFQDDSFLTRFTPGLIFLITMGSTASVACVFGMVFCLKKTLEYPSRAPSSAFNVRYTPLKDEATLQYS